MPPVGWGEDRICPLLGSVEWHDPVKLCTFPQLDGGGEFTHCSRVQGGKTPQVGLCCTIPPTRHTHSLSHSQHTHRRNIAYTCIVLQCRETQRNQIF